MQAFGWGKGMDKSIGTKREQVVAKSHWSGGGLLESKCIHKSERESFLELEKGTVVQYIRKAVMDGYNEHHQLIKSSKNPM